MRFRACRPLLPGCAALLAAAATARAADRADIEAPRVTATLEQGLAVEAGSGLQRNPRLAIKLYCEAGIMGSSEGYFRIARVLARGPAYLRNPPLANAYFALAARLGHHAAFEQFDRSVVSAPLLDDCRTIDVGPDIESFDLDGYLSALSPAKRRVAALIRRHAGRYGIDVRIALAIAMAESNLDAQAVSPRNAQGVMQLIPGTQERFGVRNAFDAESNIKGGLAYLRWLKARAGRRRTRARSGAAGRACGRRSCRGACRARCAGRRCCARPRSCRN